MQEVEAALTLPRHHRGMAARIIVTPEFVDIDHPLIARALLRHIVEHADIVGQDHKGRAVLRFEFAAEPWLLDNDPAEEEAVEWVAEGRLP